MIYSTEIVQKIESKNRKSYENKHLRFFSAEEEGFEPPEVWPSTVFKTAAFDHSAIPPKSDIRDMSLFGLQI